MQPISRSSWYPLLLLLLDTVVVAVALWFAYFVRFEVELFVRLIPTRGEWDPGIYLRIWPVATVLLVVSYSFMRLHDYGMRTFDLDIFQRIVTATALGALLFFTMDFFLRGESLSRVLTLMAPCVAAAGVTMVRSQLNQWLVSRRVAGLDRRRVAIVGIGQASTAITSRIRANPQYGYEVVGHIAPDLPEGERPAPDATPVLGAMADLPRLLRAHQVEAIIVASPHVSHDEYLEIFQACERDFVACKLAPDLFELMLRDMHVENLEGVPLMAFKETPLQGWNFVLKRMFDIVAGSGLLVILSPLFAVITAMIKIESRGPILYVQERMGLDGHVFNMIKFRSMHLDAEAEGPVWSRESDPRRTRVGRLIRALNFDELPQLINVIRGDMSLVGPRPERPHFIQQFKSRIPRYMARHRVRAGMTGWAQVHGLRGNTSIDERLKYDLHYIENWSFWMDIKILLMTLRGSRRPVV
jgi:exopolysaccharide biosynthesis polyprenyl glycosylphosphotransferase